MTSLSQRQNILILINEAVAGGARQAKACELIGLSARTLQRWQTDPQQGDLRPERVQSAQNSLSELEREQILGVINSDEYGHLPPSQIVPRLADKGLYLASESTLYRLLRRTNQIKHRGAQRPRQPAPKPEPLRATAPNQLYSWDITYLPTSVKGQYFYLYLFLDLFSRKVVGWQVFDTECGGRAADLLRDICQREAVGAHQLVLHSDNGGPMKGATMLATLQELGIASSFSRPAVSNDNPFSETLFRTLKYRPHYPCRPFKHLRAARAWVHQFVRWYNTEHRHSAIGFVTPEQRHNGDDHALLRQRRSVYEAARHRHPERWSGAVRNWSRINTVDLNPQNTATVKKATKPVLKQAA